MNVPRCLGCGDRLPPVSEWQRDGGKDGQVPVTWDNQFPTRGPYGDGLACSLDCAQQIMARVFSMATEQGWDLRGLLPEEWRPDLVPWEAWRAGAKLKGKRAWVNPRKK